eukprot:7633473-Lingulodinium_polyedra.AAC.1
MFAHGGNPLIVMFTRCGAPPWTSIFCRERRADVARSSTPPPSTQSNALPATRTPNRHAPARARQR